jgi:soluble lytic murein transglycosylase
MSPPTATASARRRPSRSAATARRRAVARRRRRIVLALVAGVAVVVLIVMALPLAKRAVNDLGLPLDYSSVIRQQAALKHLDPALVAAVIYAETKFDPRTSSAGAEGLMQLMPGTASFLAHRSGATTFTTADLATPQVNIAYGSYYLRYLLNEFHGNVVEALAAYNGGEANVHAWIAAAHAGGRPFGVDDIPFPETRDYVQRVLQARSEYRRTYPGQLGR